jgi:hypothetical protein
MTITPPPAADLKARYPVFADVSDALIDAVMGEAAQWVDTSWRAADRVPAVLALAAHLMAVEGALDGGASGSAVNGPVASSKVGDVAVTFANRAAASMGDLSGFGETAYGQQFLRLRRRNFPAVLAV